MERQRAMSVATKAGMNESQPLDFYSPYGCSKGAADQYVHDYSRMFGLPTVVFRMSCIAGAGNLATKIRDGLRTFFIQHCKTGR